MNWLLAVMLAVVVLCAADGHRKGFIKKSIGVVSWALILAVTSKAGPVVRVLLEDYTDISSTIQNSLMSGDDELLEAMSVLGMEDVVSGYISGLILQVAAFLLTFLAAALLIKGILLALGIVAKLPVFNGLNRLAGFVLGLAEGLLLVCIFFFVVTVSASTEWGGTLLKMIAENDILTWAYKNNLLFLIL